MYRDDGKRMYVGPFTNKGTRNGDNDFWESEVVYYIYTTTAVLTPAAGEKKILVYKSKQIFL